MNINKKEDFSFVHKDHKCIAYLTYDGIVFDGCAICHPKDRDFESKKTGEKIASMRTLEKVYAYLIKKCDIEINTLKMLKNAYLQSGFEKDDYIFKSINKQLQKKNALKSACIQEKKQLKFSIYITIGQKDTLYKNIRQSRRNNRSNPYAKGNKKE